MSEMLEEMNQRLAECKENIHYRDKWKERLAALELREKELKHQTDMWQRQLSEEEADVQKLTSVSFANLWYSLTGKREEQLKQEELEVLEAKLKFQQSAQLLEDTVNERKTIQERWEQVRHAEAEYQGALLEKERLIHRHYPAHAEMLSALSDRKAESAVRLKEWKEAVYEGRGALNALEEAAKSLDSAKNWGVYDMMGGGMISTHIKHSRMDEAVSYAREAGQRLIRFQDELKDVQLELADYSLDLGELLRFSDYFLDGLLVDYAVQGRINDSREQIAAQISRIGHLVHQLETELRRCESELAQLDREYSYVLETSK
jgi:hypothetical protein